MVNSQKTVKASETGIESLILSQQLHIFTYREEKYVNDGAMDVDQRYVEKKMHD